MESAPLPLHPILLLLQAPLLDGSSGPSLSSGIIYFGKQQTRKRFLLGQRHPVRVGMGERVELGPGDCNKRSQNTKKANHMNF